MSDLNEQDEITKTAHKKVTERSTVAGIRVVEVEYKVHRPVYEDVKIDKPVYVEKQIEVPTGIESVIETLSKKIAEEVLAKVIAGVDQQLREAIDRRIKEVQVPQIIYRTEEKVVEVPVYKDVTITRPIFVDKEIVNPVVKDVEVQNAILKDVIVDKPVFKDRVVINPVFEEVKIDKPNFVEKEVTVIHLKYVDMKGNPEPVREG